MEECHTLADGLPPDVLNGASALAVDTLDLVGTDDGVLQSTALEDREDGVAVITLGLAGTLDTTAEGLHASVVDLTLADLVGLLEGLGSLGLGQREGVALVESTEGRGGQEREENSLLNHCCGIG